MNKIYILLLFIFILSSCDKEPIYKESTPPSINYGNDVTGKWTVKGGKLYTKYRFLRNGISVDSVVVENITNNDKYIFLYTDLLIDKIKIGTIWTFTDNLKVENILYHYTTLSGNYVDITTPPTRRVYKISNINSSRLVLESPQQSFNDGLTNISRYSVIEFYK